QLDNVGELLVDETKPAILKRSPFIVTLKEKLLDADVPTGSGDGGQLPTSQVPLTDNPRLSERAGNDARPVTISVKHPNASNLDCMTGTPRDGNAASATQHSQVLAEGRNVKATRQKYKHDQTAAWPWVRAGVASTLNCTPDRRQCRVDFFEQRSSAAICALMSTRPRSAVSALSVISPP